MRVLAVAFAGLLSLAAGCGGNPAAGPSVGRYFITDIELAYRRNEAHANDEFNGKVIDLECAVVSVEEHGGNAVAFIANYGGNDPAMAGKVLMASRAEGVKLEANSRALLKCRCRGVYGRKGLLWFDGGTLITQKPWQTALP